MTSFFCQVLSDSRTPGIAKVLPGAGTQFQGCGTWEMRREGAAGGAPCPFMGARIVLRRINVAEQTVGMSARPPGACAACIAQARTNHRSRGNRTAPANGVAWRPELGRRMSDRLQAYRPPAISASA